MNRGGVTASFEPVTRSSGPEWRLTASTLLSASSAGAIFSRTTGFAYAGI